MCTPEYNERSVGDRIPKKMLVKEISAALYPGETFNKSCSDCNSCLKCDKIQHDNSDEENRIIRESVRLNDEENQITCSLPLREGWKERISDTSTQAKSCIKKEIEKLSHFPKQRDELAKSFKTLISLGFIQRYKNLIKAERDIVDSQVHNYFLPISIAYKPDSVSTTVRLCMDASTKTAGKSSPQQVIPFFQTQDRGLERAVLVDGSLSDARRRARTLLRHLLDIRGGVSCRSI